MSKDFVAINISNNDTSYPPNSKLFCNLCSCNLTLLDADKEEWICSRCNVSYFPNKGERVKRANKFTTPGPETDAHGNITGEKMPLVSMVDDKKDLSSSFKQPKLSPFFADMLKRPGIRIIDYQTSED
jgi:hypothetical protein